MEYLIHIANILYLLSYLVREILWLRVITVIAASFLIPYFYFRPEPLTTAIYWNLVFTSLNIFWIIRLLIERRPVHLSGNDLRLYQLAFRCLTPREMLHLIKLGRWERADSETCFISQGDVLDRLMVICVGKASVVQDGRIVEELGAGQFIGGVLFISENIASADIVAVEEIHYMSWPKLKLHDFLKDHAELHTALQLTLGFDLIKRLEATYAADSGN